MPCPYVGSIACFSKQPYQGKLHMAPQQANLLLRTGRSSPHALHSTCPEPSQWAASHGQLPFSVTAKCKFIVWSAVQQNAENSRCAWHRAAAVRAAGQHLPRVVAAEEPLPAVILHKNAVLDAHKLRLATAACAQQLLLGGTAHCSQWLGALGATERPQNAANQFALVLRQVLARAARSSVLHCHLFLCCCSLVDRLPVVACQLIRVINSLAKLMGQSSSHLAHAPLGHQKQAMGAGPAWAAPQPAQVFDRRASGVLVAMAPRSIEALVRTKSGSQRTCKECKDRKEAHGGRRARIHVPPSTFFLSVPSSWLDTCNYNALLCRLYSSALRRPGYPGSQAMQALRSTKTLAKGSDAWILIQHS